MIVALSAALTGLLVAGEQGSSDLILRHDISPRYNRTEHESACGSTIFRVRFRNGPEEHGRVDHVLIDGRPVTGAAEMLDIRAARRLITSIEILNCGTEPGRPVFQGMINFEPMESRGLGMRWSLAFRLIRESRDSWRMTID